MPSHLTEFISRSEPKRNAADFIMKADKHRHKKVKCWDFLGRFHGQAQHQGSRLEGGNYREMVAAR